MIPYKDSDNIAAAISIWGCVFSWLIAYIDYDRELLAMALYTALSKWSATVVRPCKTHSFTDSVSLALGNGESIPKMGIPGRIHSRVGKWVHINCCQRTPCFVIADTWYFSNGEVEIGCVDTMLIKFAKEPYTYWLWVHNNPNQQMTLHHCRHGMMAASNGSHGNKFNLRICNLKCLWNVFRWQRR